MDNAQTIYFTAFADGTYAECMAYDADDALDQMARSSEMLHGPIAGRAPADADVDRSFGE